MKNIHQVFHIALPDVSLYKKEIKQYYLILERLFKNVLLMAEQYNAESVALPLIYSSMLLSSLMSETNLF